MITVKYTKYRNDFDQRDEVKTFSSLQGLQDWLFDMKSGSYERGMYFTNPDDDHMFDGKLSLDSSCISSSDGTYSIWVKMISNDKGIMYSTGAFTNRICYWNDEIKDFLRSSRARQKNPQFNFV